MLKDIRYIIKKVIIGVAIALIVFLLKTQVFALTWDLVEQTAFGMFDNDNARFTDSSNNSGSNKQKNINAIHNYTNSNNYNFMVIPFNFTGSTSPNFSTFNSSDSIITYSTQTVFDFVYRVTLWDTTGGGHTCEVQNNFLVCPLENGKTYKGLTFYYNMPAYSYISLTVSGYVSLYNSLFFAMTDNQGQANQKLDEIKNSIQSQTQDQQDNSDANVDVSNMGGITGLLPAGPVDSLLALPLTLINLLISGTSGTCSPFTFTFVFGEQFTLPCFDSFWNQVPTSLLIFLSDLPAVYIFIQWSKSIYKRVERAVSFESSVDDEWGGV